ncbi:MAG: T9SS type A sorting domain-containing protein [Bacteroidales bacterium]|nr:T9SS type A sorting domain-containing protein [Bacteroidales bacterium]MCF8456994.1 T9SS type A sorting domain-containing protein [Bacteroidales bacterium]
MYYGTSLDMEVKQTVACNKATELAGNVMASYFGPDNTPPSVFIPQRYPYNPGGTGFGPNYSYQQFQNGPDFHVWTFAFDYSGVQSAVLKYRLDNDGVNPLTDNDNDTYAGGSGVGSWNSITMTQRLFPAGNYTNNPDIDFFVMPNFIANQYYAEITGYNDTLIDYYVEVTDNSGNITKTAIQHVYVGANTSAGSTDGVHWIPSNPTNEDTITIIVPNVVQGGKLHWGVNHTGSSWTTPDQSYWPAGSYLFNGSGPAIETPLIGPSQDSILTLKLGPFNNPAQEVETVAFVIHYDSNIWDNNNGGDYYIPITTLSLESDLIAEEKLLVYPNPAMTEISIKIVNQRRGHNDFGVEIIDSYGRVVKSTKLNSQLKLDVSNLDSGVYNVKVVDNNSEKGFVERVVIMK